MGHLANNKLRTENMIKLLENMHFNLEGQKITCHDEWVFIQSDSPKQAETMISELTTLLLDDPSMVLNREKITLEKLITDLIKSASNTDKTLHEACIAMLPILARNWQYQYDPETKQLNIELPTYMQSLFAALKSDALNIVNNQLTIKMNMLLEQNQDVLHIDEKSPLILVRHELFSKKKIFYAQQTLENGNIEIQPYFHLPKDVTPPDYHFVLDTSSSMEEHIENLKDGVIRFAEALFAYQPTAKISIQIFNTNVENATVFSSSNMGELGRYVNKINAYGSTALYRTVNQQLARLEKLSLHNNILLFTDGYNDDVGVETQIETLNGHIERIRKDLRISTCNKFFIINYLVKKDEYLKEVIELFASEYISAEEVDLQQALKNADQLGVWASKRGLFTYSVQVIDGQFCEYSLKADYADQFVALDKLEFSANENMEIELTIKDVQGEVILSDKRCLNNPTPKVKSSQNTNNSSTPNLWPFFTKNVLTRDEDLNYHNSLGNN